MGRFTISRPSFCGELDCSTMLWLWFVCLVVNAGKTSEEKCFYYASKTCAGLLMKRKGGEPHEHTWYSLKKPCVHRHPSFLHFLLHRWGFPQDCECFVWNCFKKKNLFTWARLPWPLGSRAGLSMTQSPPLGPGTIAPQSLFQAPV